MSMTQVTVSEIERIKQVLREIFCRDVDVQPRETADCFNCYHITDIDNISIYYFPGTRNLMIEERSHRGVHRVYINIDTRETRSESLLRTPCGFRRLPLFKL